MPYEPEPDIEEEEDEFESEIIEESLSEYASIKSIVSEALPFEILATFGGVVAGIILSGMTTQLEIIPGLIVIAPAVLGLRGNISCALGSRLGSAVHMGLITKVEKNPELINNIGGSLTLSLILTFALGLMGHYITLLMGLESAGAVVLTSIAVLSGVSSGLILSIITVLLALGMFRFGFDPDNIVTPSIATLGDIVSMFMLFVATKVVIAI